MAAQYSAQRHIIIFQPFCRDCENFNQFFYSKSQESGILTKFAIKSWQLIHVEPMRRFLPVEYVPTVHNCSSKTENNYFHFEAERIARYIHFTSERIENLNTIVK